MLIKCEKCIHGKVCEHLAFISERLTPIRHKYAEFMVNHEESGWSNIRVAMYVAVSLQCGSFAEKGEG